VEGEEKENGEEEGRLCLLNATVKLDRGPSKLGSLNAHLRLEVMAHVVIVSALTAVLRSKASINRKKKRREEECGWRRWRERRWRWRMVVEEGGR